MGNPTPVQQLIFFLTHGLPTSAIFAWIESLPETDRAIVSAELERVTKNVMAFMDTVEWPEYSRDVVNGIAAGLTNG